MSTSPRHGLRYLSLALTLVLGCSDPIPFGTAPGTGGTAGIGGGAGSGGVGGMGGSGGSGGMAGGDAGFDCNEVGCDDGNQCTIDGSCNTLTGICIGGGENEVVDTPCSQNDGFFCDGGGRCVVCNDESQCASFFPPQDCREPASCVDNQCPIPDPLPDGTPCSTGHCYQGWCVALLPQSALVPMVCHNSVTPAFWEIPLDMTVAPSAIQATRTFTADIHATLAIPQEFLQYGLISVFPTELTSLGITTAGAEIVTHGVLSGSPVSTTLGLASLTVPISQVPNPGDPGGGACAVDDDCPLVAFGQTCGVGGQCECACRVGCTPATCANLVTGDVLVPLNPIFSAPYTAAASGSVCFDAGGTNPPSSIGAPPVRTGIRAIASNGAFVRFECVGGTVNDNGTPELPSDDFVHPNPPNSQICFPIETPDVDLCEGPPPVDCADANQCAVDAVCDPFVGDCTGGSNEPRGTACSQNGGTFCDGQGACVQCVEDSQCADDGNQCTTAPACEADRCRMQTNVPQGAVCDQDGGNRCDGNGSCVYVGEGPFPETKELTLGCTSSVSADVSIVPFELRVSPGPPVAGQTFAADLRGSALLPEELLDSVQWAIPGGATRVDLIDVRATVHVRSGGTGDDVVLNSEPIPYRCAFDETASCDPANDLPGVPGRRGNSDCMPTGANNPCGRFLQIPTSDDCEPGGVCDTLDAGTAIKDNQCTTHGFCVTGALPLPLQARVGSYVAAGSGEVLFGWDDASTGATVGSDGTWVLPAAVFGDPIGPNGIQVSIDGLSVALECTMGVDSGGIYGVGVPGRSSPMPNSQLIGFSIGAP